MRAKVLLPPWFAPGDDEDTLGGAQGEVVAHHAAVLTEQAQRQRHVERIDGAHVLALGHHLGEAEAQAPPLEPCGEVEVGQVELDLALEPRDAVVDEVGEAVAEGFERRERLGVEPGHQLEDGGLDRVQLEGRGTLLWLPVAGLTVEPREGAFDRGGVILVPGGSPDVHPVLQDREPVRHGVEVAPHPPDLLVQRGEGVGLQVPAQVGGEAAQAVGRERRPGEPLRQRGHGVAVGRGGAELQAGALPRVAHRLGQRGVVPHALHGAREALDLGPQPLVGEVAEHGVPEGHVGRVFERGVEQGPEPVPLAAGGDGRDHLIQVEVGEAGGRLCRLRRAPGRATVEHARSRRHGKPSASIMVDPTKVTLAEASGPGRGAVTRTADPKAIPPPRVEPTDVRCRCAHPAVTSPGFRCLPVGRAA
jgi:hypothetical protein